MLRSIIKVQCLQKLPQPSFSIEGSSLNSAGPWRIRSHTSLGGTGSGCLTRYQSTFIRRRQDWTGREDKRARNRTRIQYQLALEISSSFKLHLLSSKCLTQYDLINSRHIIIRQSTDTNYLTVARRSFSDWHSRSSADDHKHLKVHRLHESLPTDKSHYLAALGHLGEITPGVPVPAHYPGPAVAYVIEGMLNVFRSMVIVCWTDRIA